MVRFRLQASFDITILAADVNVAKHIVGDVPDKVTDVQAAQFGPHSVLASLSLPTNRILGIPRIPMRLLSQSKRLCDWFYKQDKDVPPTGSFPSVRTGNPLCQKHSEVASCI